MMDSMGINDEEKLDIIDSIIEDVKDEKHTKENETQKPEVNIPDQTECEEEETG